ncbi:hypothetical protein H920_06610 [Fukomys damarensis]|uniref:Uncharacterized protein n=1 Tax=Fukomys damarensis TaxID=885580 RepID=A0A091E9Z1_FUKDA|nr:hypothetical protein H920_06610 [Fukomys damarensis]
MVIRPCPGQATLASIPDSHADGWTTLNREASLPEMAGKPCGTAVHTSDETLIHPGCRMTQGGLREAHPKIDSGELQRTTGASPVQRNDMEKPSEVE